MKKVLFVCACLITLIGCSNKNEYTKDLTGQWYIYKITRNSIDQTRLVSDSFLSYSLTFTADGHYIEDNVSGIDTARNLGTWAFQNNYGQLALTDTTQTRTYTLFNLTGNHMELLKNTENRYFRKFQ